MPSNSKAYYKEYYEKHKEKINEKNKEYYKEYYQKNKEKLNQQKKEYHQTPQGKKSQRISKWKRRGIICNYETIYQEYINCECCNFCGEKFKDSLDRCLDHDHSITDTDNVRAILCRSCNAKDVLKKN